MPTISRSKAILAITAIAVAYFGVTAIGNAINSFKLDRERQGLEREVATYQRQYRQLLGVRDYLRSDEYVQTAARRDLGLVMPGEPAIVVISPQREVPPADGQRSYRWWELSP